MVHWFQDRVNTGRPGHRPGFPWLFLFFSIGLIVIGSAGMAQIPYLPGWPRDITEPLSSPIVIADTDDDGILELVLAGLPSNLQPCKLYAYEVDGGLVPGFPINGEITRTGDPVVFDSDDDGKLEIVAAWQDLHLFASDGTTIWYEPYNGPVFQSTFRPYQVSVDDIDNDGKPEIVVTCYSGGAIFVFDAQGNVKSGWPVLLTRPPGWTPPPIYKSASIGDIDIDGLKEIIVGVDDYTVTDPGRVHCFKPDGSLCPGFPVGNTPGARRSKAVLADINNDNHLEVIIGKESGELNAYSYAGGLIPGYPIAIGRVQGIGLGDIFRNGSKALLFAIGMFYGIQGYDAATAAPLAGFPINDPLGQFAFSMQTPNICNISDDPGLEVVSGSGNSNFVPDGKLFAWNLSGQVLPAFPSPLLFHRYLGSGCSVNDVDGNGTTDICCGSENGENNPFAHSTVYCWDTGYPYNLDNVDWAMDGYDLGHTGRWRRLYHISKAGSQLAVGGCQGQGNPCYLPPDGSLIAVDVTVAREHGGANPPGQDVRYSRTLGCGNYEGPVIDNGDGTYTRMLRAPAADCTTDLHAWVNEFKLADYQQIIFTSGCVAPPPAFSLLNPPDGAVQQPLNITLEWPAVGAFPNQATAYDLYFGPEPDPPYHQGGLTTPYFDLHSLALGTIYYWRVEARNACGITSSPVWSFTTACPVPAPFVNLCPADGATDLPLEVELAWEASAYAEGYKVYLGADSAALALVSAVSGTRHAASGLADGGTYYWQIVARNLCGETPGPVWSFTTGEGECRHCRPVSPP